MYPAKVSMPGRVMILCCMEDMWLSQHTGCSASREIILVLLGGVFVTPTLYFPMTHLAGPPGLRLIRHKTSCLTWSSPSPKEITWV